MARDTHVYGEVDSKTGLRQVFVEIRQDADQATSRPALTELYRRAGYLGTLSRAPSWEQKFGDAIGEIRDVAEEEFARTARKINTQARQVGTEPDYDETWGQ